MLRISTRVTHALFFSLIFAVCLQAQAKHEFQTVISPFLENYCLECHDDDVAKGDIELHELEDVNVMNAQLWIQVWEQVALKEMPPKEKKNKPTPDIMKRMEISEWITSELVRVMKPHGGFNSHIRPAKGNHLDHELLFSADLKDLEPTSSPARIWRIHPQEHLSRLNDLMYRSKGTGIEETLTNNFKPYYYQGSGRSNQEKAPLHGARMGYDYSGKVKLYYGLDRIVGHIGGHVAYKTAIKGFPSILTMDAVHGLKDYPSLYSVNGTEANQIATIAKDILKFMVYGPVGEPHQYVNDTMKGIDKKYLDPQIRGTPLGLFYRKETMRPLTPVYDLVKGDKLDKVKLKKSIEFLFESLTLRPPEALELKTYTDITMQAIKEVGFKEGALLGLAAIFLDKDALFRSELVEYGKPDKYGRVMLQGQELVHAINSALCFIHPDAKLVKAHQSGKLKTKADVKREVSRILNDPGIQKPKLVQFFREYFDYDYAIKVCKDDKAYHAAGGTSKNFLNSMVAAVENTDKLVEIILEEDKDVLKELLTTNKTVLNPSKDWLFLSEFHGKKELEERAAINKALAKYKKKKKKGEMTDEEKAEQKKLDAQLKQPQNTFLASIKENQSEVYVNAFRGQYKRALAELPTNQRMGILTQPSWLVSHSDAMDNHAILRGRWVRERLLGGAVPDVPITVDAMLPDEPGTSLRHRMRVTREEECWRCHQKMDPLGMPFEMFNHIGRYRTTELGEKVDASGEIIDSGDLSLDGPVKNALDMIQKLSESERVEQVFVRHVFRYWMGRNETLNDAPILREAHKAYRENGGSMKALMISLLTSDAFLYRNVNETTL